MPEVVTILVQNYNKQLFIRRRPPSDNWFPSMYSLGLVGVVGQGEDPPHAARRELLREMNTPSPIDFLFSYPFHWTNGRMDLDYVVNAFHTYRESHSDFSIGSRNNDSSQWLSLKKISELSERDRLCPDTKITFDRFMDEFSRVYTI